MTHALVGGHDQSQFLRNSKLNYFLHKLTSGLSIKSYYHYLPILICFTFDYIFIYSCFHKFSFSLKLHAPLRFNVIVYSKTTLNLKLYVGKVVKN